MSTRPLGRLLAVLLLAPLLPVLAVVGAAPAHAGVYSGAPEPGECHDASYRALLAESLPDRPVGCRSPHTLWVLGVREVPQRFAIDPADATFRDFAERTCAQVFRREIGGSLRALGRSSLQLFFFVPTPAQQREGARWVSCATASLAGERTVRTRAATPPRAVLDPAPAARLCFDRQGRFSTCSEPRTTERDHDAVVRAGRPDLDRFTRLARQTCDRHYRHDRWIAHWRYYDTSQLYVVCRLT